MLPIQPIYEMTDLFGEPIFPIILCSITQMTKYIDYLFICAYWIFITLFFSDIKDMRLCWVVKNREEV